MIFIFPWGKLMGVDDEVRLHLTETFQEEIGLSQTKFSFHIFLATPYLLIGKTQKLKCILTYQSMQWLYKALISKPVC